jgi:outer membrane immunogenic protein
MKHAVTKVLAAGALGILLLPASAAMAESGFYAGGSVGNAALEFDYGDEQAGFLTFDESDFAWKGFVGYMIDLPLVDFGVEAGYVDFGKPSISMVELDPTGWNLWGTAGLDIGPLGVYAKLGYISWDVEIREFGESFSDDGSDVGYGIGAKIDIGSLQLRGEFESYDIEDADKLDMLSVGLVWTF